MEPLDHRQLLAVTFTGNVAADFPATSGPGVVVLQNPLNAIRPTFPTSQNGKDLQSIIQVSGFELQGLRVSYDPTDDTLNLGIVQPNSGKPAGDGVLYPVIAGDADNNLNSGTTAPEVTAIDPFFVDEPDMGGTEYMAAFLDVNGDGKPDVVAGFSNSGGSPKAYQVAEAQVNPVNPELPLRSFGAAHPEWTGSYFLVNSPQQGGFEMSIKNFKNLYSAYNPGKTLAPESVLRVGAIAGSGSDDGIGEATYFAREPFTVGQASPPVPCPTPPPVSPPISVNPHENRHIDTAHDTLIRVTVYGSSGFNVRDIITDSVRLGGAAPIATITRKVNNDQFADRTFVFRGTDVDLPSGWTRAVLTGDLKNQPPGYPTSFMSSEKVFNLSSAFYTQSEVTAAAQRHDARVANGTLPAPSPGQSSFPLGHVPPSAEAAARNHVVAAQFRPMTADEIAGLATTPHAAKTHQARARASAPRFRATTVAQLRRQALRTAQGTAGSAG
ncbi:MAG: hypothetical protein U0800_21475 [Isosphaeraceae bacterium]